MQSSSNAEAKVYFAIFTFIPIVAHN